MHRTIARFVPTWTLGFASRAVSVAVMCSSNLPSPVQESRIRRGETTCPALTGSFAVTLVFIGYPEVVFVLSIRFYFSVPSLDVLTFKNQSSAHCCTELRLNYWSLHFNLNFSFASRCDAAQNSAPTYWNYALQLKFSLLHGAMLRRTSSATSFSQRQ